MRIFNKIILIIFLIISLFSCNSDKIDNWRIVFNNEKKWGYILVDSLYEGNILDQTDWHDFKLSNSELIEKELIDSHKVMLCKSEILVNDLTFSKEALFQCPYNLTFRAFLNNVEIARNDYGTIRDNSYPDNDSSHVPIFDCYNSQNFFINEKTFKECIKKGKNTLLIEILNKNKISEKLSKIKFSIGFSDENKNFGKDEPNFKQTAYFTHSNIPIIIINTNNQAIVDEPKILAEMGIINTEYNYINDNHNDFSGKIAIEIRGGTSQTFLKKSFALKLKGKKKSLLGLPKDSEWVLYGPYPDKTLLRDKLIFTLSEEMGLLAPKSKYCELVINNDYRGIYLLMQKVKISKNMVNISKMNNKDTIGDDLTGGYMLKFDRGSEEYIHSKYPLEKHLQNKYFLRFHEPKGSDLCETQKDSIKSYINNFETALYYNNNNLIDFIDIKSFVDFFIINEFSKNVDAYRLSTYIYKDKDSKNGKLTMGPLWDYNFSLGLVDYSDGYKPEGWIYNSSDYIPYWWKSFMKDETFRKQLKNRWTELRKKIITSDYINSIIDNDIDLIEDVIERNDTKWKMSGSEIWPNYFNGKTYDEEIEYLKKWIDLRISWLDKNI